MTKPPKQKKCKVCCDQFMPTNTTQTICGWKCATTYAETLATKREAKELREAKKEAKPLKYWLDLAQKWANKSVRLRDAHLPCISCGTTADVQYAAGHYRSRGSASHLRFNLDNLHKQCNRHCNMALSGNQRNYRIGLIERIGIERVEAIENDNTPHKWTIDEAKAVIAHHKLLCKQLSMTAQAAQPGQCNPVHAGTPSPNNGLVGRTGNGN